MFNTLGAGANACSQWTMDRSRDVKFSTTTDAQWVLGFFVGREDGLGVLVSRNVTDTDAIISWVDDYCQKNKEKPISSAAEAFVAEFTKANSPNP
jgi:hypothetical protein